MRTLLQQATVAALSLALSSALADAQVGYDPRHSPYRDLQQTQELTFYSGLYRAKTDPGRVAPRSGSLVGVHYQWRITGPASLTADLGRVASERRVLDPELSDCPEGTEGDCKFVGMFRWPLYLADVGLSMALTGARSYRRLVPEAKLGVGIVSDFHTRGDIGDFSFGTRFAFTWGAGIRWIPAGPYQLRADVTNHLYSVRYPETYYSAAPDGSTIFESTQSRSAWLNNAAIKIGISYLFSR